MIPPDKCSLPFIKVTFPVCYTFHNIRPHLTTSGQTKSISVVTESFAGQRWVWVGRTIFWILKRPFFVLYHAKDFRCTFLHFRFSSVMTLQRAHHWGELRLRGLPSQRLEWFKQFTACTISWTVVLCLILSEGITIFMLITELNAHYK